MTKIYINDKLILETNRSINSQYCVLLCLKENGIQPNKGDKITCASPVIENIFYVGV